MNNLANNPNYLKTIDSLKIEINLRIKDARKKPEGLGRQLKEVQYERYTYTPGDLYDETGKRVYLKPANE